ncbi:TIGR02186 family protein [Aestuariibius sp. 2305UL40-4]|uniref:TIGR02186 family protein n=1 Tax=Aestuariibius violaceus TaxID=3234132 RepID=UPI00345F0E05
MSRTLLALLCLLAGPLEAEEIVLGLSRDQVAITATFEGDDVLIFGAVRREAPIPEGAPLNVIVTVKGPDEPITVRRKERRLGIWVNTDAVEVDSAPSFYAVAATGPLREVLKDTEDLRYRITIPRAIRSVGAPMNVTDPAAFTRALIRIRAGDRLYQTLEGAVDLEAQTLFRTEIGLPANLTEGDYIVRIFLTREGRIVDVFETVIPVEKVGLERWLYNLAHEKPLIYGLMSLAIAIFAGWGASEVFRIARR